jgi:glycosyltransferase involved in cell wall biosynthesis
VSAVRVAYLLKRFPRLSESFVLNEILEVRRHGLETVVYALEDPREAIVDPRAAELQPEVRYVHRPGRGGRSWARLIGGAALQGAARPRGALRVAWAVARTHRSVPSLRHAIEGMWLARDLRARGVTHLHAHFAHAPAAVAYMAQLAGGVPFSFTAHAKDLYTTLPRNLIIRARAARFVITCTEFNRDFLEGLMGGPPVPVHVLYHGADTSRFRPNGHRPERGHIVSVGRLVPKKGYPHLIEALQHLNREGVAFACDVYGGGALRDELTTLAGGSGLSTRLKFHGARLQGEILDAYRSSALMVLAPIVTDDGDRDGIPNVLVEAMACGVPVVSTRISGIPELIEDGVDGLLVEPGDPLALALAIERVLTDADLAARLAGAGRRKVERLFDLSANSKKLADLFTENLSGRPATSGIAP